jgi:hypothetical protein
MLHLELCKKAHLSRPLEPVARITDSFHGCRLEASEEHEVAQSPLTCIDNTQGSKTKPRDILRIWGAHKKDIAPGAKAKSVFFVSNWFIPFTEKTNR